MGSGVLFCLLNNVVKHCVPKWTISLFVGEVAAYLLCPFHRYPLTNSRLHSPVRPFGDMQKNSSRCELLLDFQTAEEIAYNKQKNKNLLVSMYIWEVIKIGLNIDICFLVFLSFNWQVNRDRSLDEITLCDFGKYQLPVCQWTQGKYIIGAYVDYFLIMKYSMINLILIYLYGLDRPLHFVLFIFVFHVFSWTRAFFNFYFCFMR